MNNLNDIFFAPAANQDLTYDQVLEDVQRYFAENHASTIAEAGEGNAERAIWIPPAPLRKYSGIPIHRPCSLLAGPSVRSPTPARIMTAIGGGQPGTMDLGKRQRRSW